MTTKAVKINNWGVLNLFISYLKHNRAIIISMFLLPIVFIIPISVNYKIIIGKGNVSPTLIIMLIWIIQSASFAIQTFLTILLDFKQSIIYRRIGLTRIKKINFLFMSSIFNLILMSISNLFILFLILILAIAFKENALINSIFHWKMLLSIVFTFAFLILLTSVSLLMSVFIKTRTGQTISSLIVNFLIIIPLFILIFFLNNLIGSINQITNTINIGVIISISIISFIFINLISILFYYLAWKFFKWYE